MSRHHTWSTASVAIAAVLLAAAPLAAAGVGASTKMPRANDSRHAIVVSPAPSNEPAANGDRLLAAMSATASASFDNRFLIRIEPGIYDLGTRPLVMRPFVDIEGSGPAATQIRGRGQDPTGTLRYGMVVGASQAELRDLELHPYGDPVLIAMFNPRGTAPMVRNVAITAADADSCWAIRNLGATPRIYGVEIDLACAGVNTGLAFLNDGETVSGGKVEQTAIRVAGARLDYGVFLHADSTPATFVDNTITVGTPGESGGVGLFVSSEKALPGASVLELRQVIVETFGGTGVRHEGTELALSLFRSQILGAVDGILITDDVEGTVQIDHSTVNGSRLAVDSVAPAYIGSSRLGGSIAAPARCAGVYDGDYRFYPDSCP